MKKAPEKKIAVTQTDQCRTPRTALNILVVEDSRTQAKQMKILLERAGFVVRLAGNGQEALEEISRNRPSLVISDVVMPGMDGYQLCRTIRNDSNLRDLPVILLTSLSEPEDIFSGLDCGADNFVAKPFDPEYLVNRIQFLVLNSELRHGERVNFGIEVLFRGHRHFVSADRVQILHHLLSTYETTMIKSRELEKTQRQLRDLNTQLEAKVRERTAALQAENEERERAQEALAYRLRLEERLAAVSHRFINVSPDGADAAIQASLQEIGEAIQVDLSSLWLLSPDEATAMQTHLWAEAGVSPPYELGAIVPRETFAWWKYMMGSGEAVSVPDVALLPPDAGSGGRRVKEAGVKSLLVVPICAAGDQVVGFLGFAAVRHRKEWLAADTTLVKVVAEVIGKALEHRQGQKLIQEQANLLDLANDAIVVRDMEDRIIFWNRGAEKLYGWPRGAVVGKAAVDLFYKQPEQFSRIRQALLEKGEWLEEVRQIDRHGRELTVSKHWTLVRDDGGNPKSVLSIGSDITQRKLLEKKFYQAQKQESLGSLASGIAHDFNNLLAIINGYTEIIAERASDDPDIKKFSNEVLGAGRRAGHLVRQILTFARQTEPDLRPVDINSLVQEIVSVSQATFPRRITITTNLADRLPALAGDPNQIYQVLMNLMVNARDAMEGPGEIAIRTSFSHSAGGGESICLQVRDTGTGMPQEMQERIFDPFYTTKAKGEGTGLGLSVVDGIVRNHGGTVDVSSVVGRGTTFTLCFPSSEMEEAAPGGEKKASAVRAGQKQRILVVDDEAAIREMVALVLEQSGYAVTTAVDGRDALGILERDDGFDVIVADYDMPHATGADIFHEILRRKIGAKFILLSGYISPNAIKALRQDGLKWSLNKPLSVQDVLAVVSEAIEAP